MFQPPFGKPWLLYCLLGVSLALNLVMVVDPPGDDESAGEEVAPATEPQPALKPSSSSSAASAPGPVEPKLATEDVRREAEAQAAQDAGWKVVRGTVEHSLARTFQNTGAAEADALTAVFARLFVWDLDLRKDLQNGDKVEVAYRVGADGKVEVSAARLTSGKLGQSLAAYQWQAPGDDFPTYWRDDGIEVPHKLKDSPIDNYEQITSLVKDRPTHRGMDFKAPQGTQVVAPRSGTVERINWNWKNNGDCVEVRYDDGVVAKFLHLSETRVKDGQRVTKGQVLALSGNTGHSTAPHLHYELERNERMLDPLDYHTTYRRHLESQDLVTFLQEQARLESVLSQSLASN